MYLTTTSSAFSNGSKGPPPWCNSIDSGVWLTRSIPYTLILVLLLLARTAQGGGLEIGFSGAQALGRGGAFTAKADNPIAITYNPAGLAQLQGHQLAVSMNLYHHLYRFTRLADSASGDHLYHVYPSIEPENPWSAAPQHLMVTSDLGLFERLTFSAGVFFPSAMGKTYPRTIDDGGTEEKAPQRYDLTSFSGIIFFPTIAVGYRPFDWLLLGASFHWMYTSLSVSMTTMAMMLCENLEDPRCDIDITVEGQDIFTPAASAGVLLRPGKNLELGVMVRWYDTAHLDGTATVVMGSEILDLEQEWGKPLLDPQLPSISITNPYPLLARAGVRYIFRHDGVERGDIELDLVYEQWSQASKRTIKILGTLMNNQIVPVTIDWRLRDTFTICLGAEYAFYQSHGMRIIGRGGGYYQTPNTATADANLWVPGGRQLAVTAGLGWQLGRYTLDVAYSHLNIATLVNQQSDVRAIDLLGGEPPVIGAGVYDGTVHTVSLQFSVALESKSAPPPPRPPTPEAVPPPPSNQPVQKKAPPPEESADFVFTPDEIQSDSADQERAQDTNQQIESRTKKSAKKIKRQRSKKGKRKKGRYRRLKPKKGKLSARVKGQKKKQQKKRQQKKVHQKERRQKKPRWKKSR